MLWRASFHCHRVGSLRCERAYALAAPRRGTQFGFCNAITGAVEEAEELRSSGSGADGLFAVGYVQDGCKDLRPTNGQGAKVHFASRERFGSALVRKQERFDVCAVLLRRRLLHRLTYIMKLADLHTFGLTQHVCRA